MRNHNNKALNFKVEKRFGVEERLDQPGRLLQKLPLMGEEFGESLVIL